MYSLGDHLKNELQACLPIFVERLKNEPTRLSTMRAMVKVASSPLENDVLAILVRWSDALRGFFERVDFAGWSVGVVHVFPSQKSPKSSLGDLGIDRSFVPRLWFVDLLINCVCLLTFVLYRPSNHHDCDDQHYKRAPAVDAGDWSLGCTGRSSCSLGCIVVLLLLLETCYFMKNQLVRKHCNLKLAKMFARPAMGVKPKASTNGSLWTQSVWYKHCMSVAYYAVSYTTSHLLTLTIDETEMQCSNKYWLMWYRVRHPLLLLGVRSLPIVLRCVVPLTRLWWTAELPEVLKALQPHWT